MSTLTVTLPEGASVVDGKQLTFVAPCDCTGVTDLKIGEDIYELVDATNARIKDKGNQFLKGAMVSVILNISTKPKRAYIQNSANSVVVDVTPTVNSLNFVTSGTIYSELGKKLNVSGGKLSGNLTLNDNPTENMHAATKSYVDSAITNLSGDVNNKLDKSGGKLTGALTLAADPTASMQAVTKQYVDNKIADFGLFVASADEPDVDDNRKTKILWINTNQKSDYVNVIHYYNGSEWVPLGAVYG